MLTIVLFPSFVVKGCICNLDPLAKCGGSKRKGDFLRILERSGREELPA